LDVGVEIEACDVVISTVGNGFEDTVDDAAVTEVATVDSFENFVEWGTDVVFETVI